MLVTRKCSLYILLLKLWKHSTTKPSKLIYTCSRMPIAVPWLQTSFVRWSCVLVFADDNKSVSQVDDALVEQRLSSEQAIGLWRIVRNTNQLTVFWLHWCQLADDLIGLWTSIFARSTKTLAQVLRPWERPHPSLSHICGFPGLSSFVGSAVWTPDERW